MLRVLRVLPKRPLAASLHTTGVSMGEISTTCAESAGDFMSKVKETFPKDSAVAIHPKGNGEFDVKTVECATDLEALDLDADNKIRMFMAEEEEGEGFLAAAGLGPWYRKASFGFLFGITAMSNEWYIMNEETFVGLCLGGFGLMTYLHARKPFEDWFVGERDAMLKAQNDAEDKHIAACETFLAGQSGTGSLDADIAAAFAEKAQLVDLEASANAVKERISVKAEFERRLASLLNQKADEENQMYKKMVADARAYVAEAVTKPAFQKEALAYAITAISEPTKVGANPTAKLFEDSLGK